MAVCTMVGGNRVELGGNRRPSSDFATYQSVNYISHIPFIQDKYDYEHVLNETRYWDRITDCIQSSLRQNNFCYLLQLIFSSVDACNMWNNKNEIDMLSVLQINHNHHVNCRRNSPIFGPAYKVLHSSTRHLYPQDDKLARMCWLTSWN